MWAKVVGTDYRWHYGSAVVHALASGAEGPGLDTYSGEEISGSEHAILVSLAWKMLTLKAPITTIVVCFLICL